MDNAKDLVVYPKIIKACYAGDLSGFAECLARGEDINSLDVRDNRTSLHIACEANNVLIVDVILAHDAVHHDVDFCILSSYCPRVAWQHAQDAGHRELAERVWRAGENSHRRKVLLRKIERYRAPHNCKASPA